jgi:hypothetical protein
MKNTIYGDGAKGMAFQRAEDASGLGVICEARRKDGRSRFIEAWRYRWLPHRDFASYAELRSAVNALDDAAIQREREAWPKATEFEHDTGNRCWMDGRPGAVFITVQTSWCEYDGAPLCAACGDSAKADPGVVVRAVAKRRADVAAMPPLSEHRRGRRPPQRVPLDRSPVEG